MFVSLCGYVHVSVGTQGGQKRVGMMVEAFTVAQVGLELHSFLSLSSVWMTGTGHCDSLEGSSHLTSCCLAGGGTEDVEGVISYSSSFSAAVFGASSSIPTEQSQEARK